MLSRAHELAETVRGGLTVWWREQPEAMDALAELVRMADDAERLREALQTIADHKAVTAPMGAPTPAGVQYVRLLAASEIARAALEASG